MNTDSRRQAGSAVLLPGERSGRVIPWAKAYYQQQRQRGKNRWSVLRSLAFIWIRILWKCWQTRTPYDEKRYMDQLRKRGSSLVQPS